MTDLHIGFTGTRKGMTDAQQRTVLAYMQKLRWPDPDRAVHLTMTLHHGDCEGGDEQFHRIGSFNIIEPTGGAGVDKIVIHPPDDDTHRAFCKTAPWDEVRDPKPYLARDADIVLETGLLIAAPRSMKEQRRGSGTWATIRMARQLDRPIFIAWPDGSWTVEWGAAGL